jgi:hypothetical protein
MATEHYVTAMTNHERYMVMACRCGEIVKADMSHANGTFSMHIAEAQEREARQN